MWPGLDGASEPRPARRVKVTGRWTWPPPALSLAHAGASQGAGQCSSFRVASALNPKRFLRRHHPGHSHKSPGIPDTLYPFSSVLLGESTVRPLLGSLNRPFSADLGQSPGVISWCSTAASSLSTRLSPLTHPVVEGARWPPPRCWMQGPSPSPTPPTPRSHLSLKQRYRTQSNVPEVSEHRAEVRGRPGVQIY